jgi:hypothetical protein
MGKPLSVDLRSPLVAAVTPGMSRRGAAEPFDVCRHRRALGASRPHDGHHCGQTAGRRHTFAPHRSIQRRESCGGRSAERHQTGQVGGSACGASMVLLSGPARSGVASPS